MPHKGDYNKQKPAKKKKAAAKASHKKRKSLKAIFGK